MTCTAHEHIPSPPEPTRRTRSAEANVWVLAATHDRNAAMRI